MTGLSDRIDALGPWFHNLRLDGIQTAPDHPLGDYPAFKWEGFRHAVPEDLTGRSVLDIGCNAGFYAIEMARRGAERVVGIDSDPRYLAQARLAAEASGAGIEFREMSVYDVAQLNESFDFVIFMGVLYHLRHPLLALDLLWEHAVGDRMLFQSMQRGSAEVAEPAHDYPFEDHDTLRPGRLAPPALHRASLRAGSDELVHPEPRRGRGDAAQCRVPDRGAPGTRGLSLPP